MQIYHNPRCTKSRETLAMIESSDQKVEVIEYLQTPPTARELQEILGKLGMKAEQIVRTNEDIYKEKFKGKTMSESDWISALVKNPILIERPIVVKGNKAVLGRPPENVKALLK